MLDKTYSPSDIEARIAGRWEEAGAFKAGAGAKPGAEPFCIVIPPPNVTGSLHIGHALNNTLQDVLARFERMRGKDVLWQPGTDHAGIATQMVVERKLAAEQQPNRREMGREAFVSRVWEWKEESGGQILNQLRRLGASCDWSRERFTMDEGLSRAVAKLFVQLFDEGLIYRDKRLVNWDPQFQTAISDLEVEQVEVKGSLWHIAYAIADEAGNPTDENIVVATTRPETLLGDTAVAVHPENENLKHLIGKKAIVPIVNRLIPIVGDDYADPEKGTGAVKITPAHDFNDFEVGRRHGLTVINVFTKDACIKSDEWDVFDLPAPAGGEAKTLASVGSSAGEVPEELKGLDRFDARKRVVAIVEEAGRLVTIEPNVHTVPHGDRSHVVVEPYLTDQWYLNVKPLAERAMTAVRDGRTRFVPENWDKTFFHWLEGIEPWCISRQLWWGHQIPVWYGPKIDENGSLTLDACEVFSGETEAAVVEAAAKRYGKPIRVVPKQPVTAAETSEISDLIYSGAIPLWRDEDVLDTWFSSALWPFSTLGWPDQTPELARYYPTTVLVTGFDIIFFWVARMMMMGLHVMDEVPFKDVYIHALVRDEKGAKMSKSKGNVIDPLELVDAYGADALRFTLAAMAAQGRDIKLARARVEGYRNFATKLWNASRFAEMNGSKPVAGFDPKAVKSTLNRWILGETAKAAAETTAAIEAYRFNEAAASVYRFVWNVVCDWYVELAKPVLQAEGGAEHDEETRATLAYVLDQSAILLHPFMPFVTEELWAARADDGVRSGLLALAPWPSLEGLGDAASEAEIGWLVELVTELRSARAEMGVPASASLPIVVVGADEAMRARAERAAPTLARIARAPSVTFADAAPKGALQLLVRGQVVAVPLEGVVDLDAERQRLAKERDKTIGEIKRIDGKLSNESFVARAPEEVVEGEREKRASYEDRLVKIEAALKQLAA